MVAGELCLILETNVGCLQATDCYQSNAYFLCMNNDMLSENISIGIEAIKSVN
jgi:hypothetical protein